MGHQKALSFFTMKTKCSITGFIVTLLGIYFVYLIFYEELIRTPFKILYSLELTKNYHSALAVVSSVIAWGLISNLPLVAFSRLKDDHREFKLVVIYLVAASLIVYTGSVIAHNLALTYIYSMP